MLNQSRQSHDLDQRSSACPEGSQSGAAGGTELPPQVLLAAPPSSPAPPLPPGGGGRGGGGQKRRRESQRAMKTFLGFFAALPAAALAAVIAALLVKAWPAILYNGTGFFTQRQWQPGGQYSQPVVTNGISHPLGASYGALPLIVGTVESSALALVMAVPIAIGTALVVVHKLPPRLSTATGLLLEILAGVPSVVIGLWGTIALGPFIARRIAPLIAHNVPDIAALHFLRGPVGYGQGLLTSAVVLAVMILPIIAATTRDLLRQVPTDATDGAAALGMTDAEILSAVTLPWVRAGMIGASVLGLGRALGETMAVAMVSGAVLGAMPSSIYQAMTTIAATIVSQLDSAFTDATGFAVRTLAEASLVLVLITLSVNVAARLLVRRVASTALPVGRGI